MVSTAWASAEESFALYVSQPHIISGSMSLRALFMALAAVQPPSQCPWPRVTRPWLSRHHDEAAQLCKVMHKGNFHNRQALTAAQRTRFP